MQLRLLNMPELDRLVCHLRRYAADNGRDGEPPYNPYPPGHQAEPEGIRVRRRASWPVAVGQPGWCRTWAMWHRDQIIGHAELHGGRIAAEVHRATLGLGIERDFRGQGLGTRLLDGCLSWARDQDSIDWIDLGVFATNEVARTLYTDAGFEVIAQTPDRFRVCENSVTDVRMTLNVASR